jgi:hypothetical protein
LRAEEITCRVEHWRTGEMFVRWEQRRCYSLRKRFQKARGCRHLHKLTGALQMQNI